MLESDDGNRSGAGTGLSTSSARCLTKRADDRHRAGSTRASVLASSAYFNEILQSIAERGRQILSLSARPASRPAAVDDIVQRCWRLLSSQGEASGMALAADILARWNTLDDARKLKFLIRLNEDFGPDIERLDRSVAEYRSDPNPRTVLELHRAAEPRRQELVRRLNLAPNGIVTLVAMREALLAALRDNPALATADADFQHLFGSWFNKGFLVLRAIDWSTPAHILEKIIRYEAVHEIRSWDELRRRLAPEDRRCFAFFHPQLVDEPLIFVEVALTSTMPREIADLLHEDRSHLAPTAATTAVFYSISNCQTGLKGVSFGNFLIKQVVDILGRQLPGLETFVTLSPVPGFARWLEGQRTGGALPSFLTPSEAKHLEELDVDGWHMDQDRKARLLPVLRRAAASYFLEARTKEGKPVDPVARFHLGNGARLERINTLGDTTPTAMQQAHGLMVNYLYKLDEIEANHERFVMNGTIAAAPQVKGLLRRSATQTALKPALQRAN